jgi:hypothetical protein
MLSVNEGLGVLPGILRTYYNVASLGFNQEITKKLLIIILSQKL